MYVCLNVVLSFCDVDRVMEDIAVFVESFKEVNAVEFNGDVLLRHFKAAYRV